MTTVKNTKGSCLCKSVQIEAKSMSNEVGACHCSKCQTWTGGPLLAVDCGSEVHITGENNISVFNSSEWAERGFCSNCGTHLYFRLKANNQYIIPVGLFGENSDLIFDHQIFIEEKPSYYAFSNDTKNMTGEEVFAHFAANTE